MGRAAGVDQEKEECGVGELLVDFLAVAGLPEEFILR